MPEEVHRHLKTRAAASGQTLSDYPRLERDKVGERPSPDELWERLRSRSPVRTRLSPAPSGSSATADGAVYLALAEALPAPLLTCDRRLAAAPGHRAVVQFAG